jgi:hypothetical protein
MRSVLLSILLVLATGAGALSAPGDAIIKSEDGLDFVVPKNSPVTLNSMGYYAEFSFAGEFTLTGTWTFGYDRSTPEDIRSRFVFIPDAATARVLPHWPGEYAKALTFTNEDAFLTAVIPAGQLAALKASQTGIVSGRVSVRADSWHAILGCGDAYYHARFVSARTRPMMIAPQKLPPEADC